MSNPDKLLFSGTTSNFIIANSAPTNLVFSCGSGSISINLKDGKVTLPPGCQLDEASLAFWRAVEQFAPMNRAAPS